MTNNQSQVPCNVIANYSIFLLLITVTLNYDCENQGGKVEYYLYDTNTWWFALNMLYIIIIIIIAFIEFGTIMYGIIIYILK